MVTSRKKKRRSDVVVCQICGKEMKSLIAHLNLIHEISCEEYKAEFGADYVLCDELREHLSSVQRQRREGTKRSSYEAMDRNEMLQQIRALVREEGELGSDKAYELRPGLWHQATYLFGNWTKAMQEAGLDVQARETWPDERIIREIRKRHKEGLPLNYQSMKMDAPRLLDAAIKHFDSWQTAVQNAGLNYRRLRKVAPLERDAIGRDLVKWADAHGEITSSALVRSDRLLYYRAKKVFGSIEQAAKELGLPFRRKSRRWTPEAVLDELRQRQASGLPVNSKAILEENSTLYHAARRHFGSYAAACKRVRSDR